MVSMSVPRGPKKLKVGTPTAAPAACAGAGPGGHVNSVISSIKFRQIRLAAFLRKRTYFFDSIFI